MSEDISTVSEDTSEALETSSEVQRLSEDQESSKTTEWLGTTKAAKRLGITTRTLYRFIDEGQVTAYRLGRVIRVKAKDIDVFIESCRITPGTIGHLYPPVSPASAEDAEEDSGQAP